MYGMFFCYTLSFKIYFRTQTVYMPLAATKIKISRKIMISNICTAHCIAFWNCVCWKLEFRLKESCQRICKDKWAFQAHTLFTLVACFFTKYNSPTAPALSHKPAILHSQFSGGLWKNGQFLLSLRPQTFAFAESAYAKAYSFSHPC